MRAYVGVEALTSGLPVVFSDQITNELNYCDYVRYLPLDLFSWVEVLKAKPINTKREEGYLFMKEHGFDIRDTVKTLEAIYDEGISAR